MSTRERRIDRARRIARRSLISVGDEFREARLAGGLSQRELGQAVGLSHSQISRIERGVVTSVPFMTLVTVGGALGLDVPLRVYPNGDRVRDAAQLAVLARLRRLVSPALRHRTEVPLGIPGDRRAWDELIDGQGWSLPVEAETRLRDVQALIRRLALKRRDAGVDRMLLAVSDTRHNRHVLRLYADDFREAFPVAGRDALAALRRGEIPPGSAIVLVQARTSSRASP